MAVHARRCSPVRRAFTWLCFPTRTISPEKFATASRPHKSAPIGTTCSPFASRHCAQLEDLRNDKTIKANLEARVIITASGDDYKRLALYADKLAGFFVVSQVELKLAAAAPKPDDLLLKLAKPKA